MSSPNDQKAHVDVFDGLRACAILMVMWLHTWQLSWMNNTLLVGGWQLNWGVIPETGFLGVELFFFISGFCLFYPYARHRLEGTPLHSLGTYVYRRAIKILPSYWLCMAVMLACTKPDYGAWRNWAWQLGSHLFFVHNWWPETENTINGVFWSLGVEVQFYVLFPLVALAFMRRPLASYAAMMLVALGWRTWVTEDFAPGQAPWLMNQLPGYVDFFASGMLTAFALVAWREKVARPWLATVVAVGGVGWLWWLMNDLYNVRYTMAFWPCPWQVDHRMYLGWAFTTIALGSVGAVWAWRKLLANAPLRFLSTISYNLYLWHQVIARLLYNNKVPMPRTTDPHYDPTWQWQYMVVTWVLAIALSALVTYLFERPLLKRGVRGLLPKRAVPAPPTAA